MQTINPDPTKYALTETGIAYLPKQCKRCYRPFTPVSESQVLCIDCGGEVEPDTLPELNKIENGNCIVEGKTNNGKSAHTILYNSIYSKIRSKIRLAEKRNDKKEVESWTLVKSMFMAQNKEGKVVDYDELVFSVFGKKPIEFDGRANNGH